MAAPLLHIVLTVLISISFACQPDSPNHLRFVTQISVRGCALFVHETGEAQAAPNLEVEPLMCVMQSLRFLSPRYDPVTKHNYVTVPVTLRDDTVLKEAQSQLKHLSPKSVKFSRVTDISVSNDASSVIKILGFLWNPDDPVGFLRLGCINGSWQCSHGSLEKYIYDFELGKLREILKDSRVTWIGTRLWERYHKFGTTVPPLSLNGVRISTNANLNYALQIQNTSLVDPELSTTRYKCLPPCNQVRFVRTLRISNCTVRVHQRLNKNGHFLVEPLMCHNIANMSKNINSVMYDISRDMYYLKLDIILVDQITLDAAKSMLSDLSPVDVSFMRVWSTKMSVSSVLRNRYEIGRFMVSDNARSGVVQVYCRTEIECLRLRFSVQQNPTSFWVHFKIQLSSIPVSQRCIVNSLRPVNPWILTEISRDGLPNMPITITMMQRLSEHVSFARNWTEYENGFGDGVNFWIGLRTINLLTRAKRATLRIEMMTSLEERVFVEYNGFTVGDARTNYTMTYTEMGSRSSHVRIDAMLDNNKTAFSTMDKDKTSFQCSKEYCGNCGFWFHTHCGEAFPTGKFPNSSGVYQGSMRWVLFDRDISLMRIRMYLRID